MLYHAPLSFSPAFGRLAEPPVPQLPASNEGDAAEVAEDALSAGDDVWRVGEEDMKVFVNSEKWSLGKWHGMRLDADVDGRLGEHEQPRPPLSTVCTICAAPPDATGHAKYALIFCTVRVSSRQTHPIASSSRNTAP